jgi:hypothetical protein
MIRRTGHRCQRQLDRRLAQGRQQIHLAAKMRVDERLGHAEFGGDVVQRRPGKAALIEELDRFLQDPFPLEGQNLVAHAPHQPN